MKLAQRRHLVQVTAIVLLFAVPAAARQNAGETPPATHLEAIAFDEHRSRRLLLYGGVVPQRGLVADLWLSNATTWMLWTPGPR